MIIRKYHRDGIPGRIHSCGTGFLRDTGGTDDQKLIIRRESGHVRIIPGNLD